jgi:hypothetical protein
MAKKTSTTKLNRVTTADQVRLGPAVAGVKGSTTAKEWRQIVKSAHARGYTLAGALDPSIPDALKPRLQSSLQNEAKKQTASAYAPVYADLDSQDRRVKAWDQKRSDDNKAYSAWLATQNAKLMADHTAATTDIMAAQKASRDSVEQAWGSIHDQTQQNLGGGANDQQGNSTALAQVGNAEAASKAKANTQYITDVGKSAAGNDSTAETLAAINSSYINSAEASRNSDISQAVKSITDDRTKAKLGQAADYLSAFSKLKDNEFSKASAVQSNATAADALHVKSQALDLEGKKFGETVRNNKANNDVAQQNADTNAAYKKAATRMAQNAADYNGDGTVDQQDNVDRRADKLAVAKHKSTGTPADQRTFSRKQEGKLSATYSNLVDLHRQYSAKKKGAHTPDTFRHVLVTRGANDQMIDIAEAARKNGGKIPPSMYGKAKAAGILHPDKVQL